MRRFLSVQIAAVLPLIFCLAHQARADDVPVLNVDPVCQGIARQASGPGERNGPDLTFRQCVSSEKAARQTLVQQWSSFTPSAKAQCTAEATAGGESSYSDLLTCLQMAQQVRHSGLNARSGK